MVRVVHEVIRFVARVPRTKCGIYVESEQAVAYPELVTCKKCRPA